MDKFYFIAGVFTIVLFNAAFVKKPKVKSPIQKVPIVFQKHVPQVFEINEHPHFFESLNKEYETSLLSAYNNDMESAYNEWLNLLGGIEEYSEKKHINIQGLKMWAKVFLRSDGKIDYLAYTLKPQSKHIDTKELTKLLSDFLKNYQFSIPSSNVKVFHYADVSYRSER